jgi:predicted nucleic acid-binding Zn ribbon protein
MAQLKEYPDFKKHTQHQAVLSTEIDKLIKGIKKIRKSRFLFWDEVVGEKIASVAVPVKNKNGVLFVKVEDAIWRFDLSRRKEDLLPKINEHLKRNLIKEIVFI